MHSIHNAPLGLTVMQRGATPQGLIDNAIFEFDLCPLDAPTQ